MILLEDLQWVDLSTLELQQLLVEQGATVPLLLLYTARPEFRPPWALRAHHTQLTLNRLGARRTREMVAHVAARGALSADVVEAVASRTGGVPLFIEELTKAALEGGARGAQEIPATLADSLMARLDRLGTAKEVAQVGAVLGREFSWALLAAVHPVPEAELVAALAKLADAELVFVRGLVPDTTYAFKHALVQDAAYESLLRSRRRELHARAARVLEEKFPDVAQHQPEVLARHHTEAGNTEEAVEWWERAGRQAIARDAEGEGVGYLRQGLAVLATSPAGPARDDRELRLRLVLGQALTTLKGYGSPETTEAYAGARAVGQRAADPTALVFLLLGLWQTSLARDGPAIARPLADEILDVAQRAGARFPVNLAHMAQTINRFYAGDFAGTREYASRILVLEDDEIGDTPPFQTRLVVLSYDAWAAWHLGHADEARALARESVAIAEREKRSAGRAWAYDQAANLYFLIRDVRAVTTNVGPSRAACAEEDNPVHDADATILQGWALGKLGDVDAGLAMFRQALHRFLATGQRLNLERYHACLADLLERAGRVDDALAALADGEGAVRGEDMDRADTLRRRAELLARRGADPSTVEVVFRDALAVAQGQGSKAYELRAATRFAGWLRSQGRFAEGPQLVATLYAGFTEGFDTPDLREAKQVIDEEG